VWFFSLFFIDQKAFEFLFQVKKNIQFNEKWKVKKQRGKEQKDRWKQRTKENNEKLKKKLMIIKMWKSVKSKKSTTSLPIIDVCGAEVDDDVCNEHDVDKYVDNEERMQWLLLRRAVWSRVCRVRHQSAVGR